MVASGGVPALAAALQHGTQCAQGYAAAGLSNVGGQGVGFAAQITAAGVVPSLVALLASSRGSNQADAAAALANLALVPHCRAAVAEAGAVPLLVAQLSHSNAGTATLKCRGERLGRCKTYWLVSSQ